MKTVVVTGATGFCGGAMLRFLTRMDVRTLALNRGDFYNPKNPKTGPSADAVARVLNGVQPDIVFHLAGTSHSSHAAELYEANLLTTLSLLSALQKFPIRPTVLLCGSAAEYGMVSAADLPLTESSKEHPSDAYGASKLAQTQLARLAGAEGFPIIVTRPFNILGPGMPRRLAFGNYLAQLKEALPDGHCKLRVGNLSSTRDFITIEDAVQSWWRLSQATAAIGQTVNLCSGFPLSIQGLIEQLQKVSPIPIETTSDPNLARLGDIREHYGDSSLLYELVGWKPGPITLEAMRLLVKQHLEVSSGCP